ncbi:Asp/Glu racemase [Amycolatopsis acidiphila]|uniref:Asp/Glu racemase n=1 Tax=Amycolatopsis acidiphila TaxID=715473 RepID=A0A557ZPV1_9PSEU|nr:Asp/Glu racemase [Amycolatopsis acidiphila]
MKRVVRGPEPQVSVGIVAPYDFNRDRELWRWVPESVSLFISRTAEVSGADNLGTVSALGEASYVARPTREVCAVGAQVVVYACTSCSFVGGARGEAALRQAMLDHGAPQALTTSGAAVDALRAVKAGRVATVHPYEEPVGRRLRRYLGDAGFDVVANTALGLPVRDVLSASYDQVADLVRAGDRPEADALFVSCTALPSYDLIAPLEEELGKPIVTANQATVWAALRAIGLSATGEGQTLLGL